MEPSTLPPQFCSRQICYFFRNLAESQLRIHVTLGQTVPDNFLIKKISLIFFALKKVTSNNQNILAPIFSQFTFIRNLAAKLFTWRKVQWAKPLYNIIAIKFYLLEDHTIIQKNKKCDYIFFGGQ